MKHHDHNCFAEIWADPILPVIHCQIDSRDIFKNIKNIVPDIWNKNTKLNQYFFKVNEKPFLEQFLFYFFIFT